MTGLSAGKSIEFEYGQSVSRATFLWLLEGVCQLHRRPFDANLILQQFPPPYDLAAFQRAACELGLNVEHMRLRNGVPVADQLPCVAVLVKEHADAVQDETDENESAADEVELALVVRADGERTLYFRAGREEPVTEGNDVFARKVEAIALHISKQETPHAEDAVGQEPQRFGFRWFIPELMRHRTIWRDVLIASFAIQLIGLVTPLFTQVVIDKVIVHRTMNTLVVIGVGLFVFMAFSAGMTWIRQYLVIHTGNRIDAVLGSLVFQHMFSLPLRYFEHRPTGTLIARVHGIETIREFITGAAVTLLLALPFLFLFLAVMFYYSWPLTFPALSLLTAIAAVSALVTPFLRDRLTKQFQLAARHQAFRA